MISPLTIAAYFSCGMSIQPHLRGLPVVVPNSPPEEGKGNVFEEGKGIVFEEGKGIVFEEGKGVVFEEGKGVVFEEGKGIVFEERERDCF
jgi:hypothetical protein